MAQPQLVPALTRLDLGAGKSRQDGWTSVDIRADFGADVTCNLGTDPWPWADNSVDEARASHFLEHLDQMERVHFANELWRVLLPGRSCLIVTPHWASGRAYGDPTHKYPVAEFAYLYWNKEWREANAPHCDFFTCHFAFTCGHTLHPSLGVRNQAYQQFAVENFKEAASDLVATVTKQEILPK